jgi:hypothetical protein
MEFLARRENVWNISSVTTRPNSSDVGKRCSEALAQSNELPHRNTTIGTVLNCGAIANERPIHVTHR